MKGSGKKLSNTNTHECPICRELADYFMRSYGDCYFVYHNNHSCVCGHLHKKQQSNCIDNSCQCKKFQCKADAITLAKFVKVRSIT